MQEENLDLNQELFNDPNCTITITNTGPLPNYRQPSQANIADATDAISQLVFADIWRLPPFRITVRSVRLDVQGAVAGGGRNWQVQINNINAPSTFAGAIIQGNLATASTAERQAYVQRQARNALVQSINDRQMKDVNGPCR
jgi:hypothetical protein